MIRKILPLRETKYETMGFVVCPARLIAKFKSDEAVISHEHPVSDTDFTEYSYLSCKGLGKDPRSPYDFFPGMKTAVFISHS